MARLDLAEQPFLKEHRQTLHQRKDQAQKQPVWLAIPVSRFERIFTDMY